jgi:hypothetical protein
MVAGSQALISKNAFCLLALTYCGMSYGLELEGVECESASRRADC